MAVYGLTAYGTDYYGLGLPPEYLVDPMVAQPQDYASISVTWNKPTGTIYKYRLLSNRYGFPVNENDGTILLDSDSYFGSVYVDQQAIPGTYHYYAIYVLVDEVDQIWIRSGVAATLMTADFGSAKWMWDNIPEYFKTLPNGGELTADAAGNVYLIQFLKVLGWGADYLKTQYWAAQNYTNNAFAMPVNQLYDMAAELGLEFAPEVPAYTMRKAVFNQSHVSRERGTLLGLRNESILRTGFDADVTIGNNILLNDDQSQFLNNITLYQQQATYKKNDLICVLWDYIHGRWLFEDDDYILSHHLWRKYAASGNYHGYVYVSLADGNVISPPIDGSNNSGWQLVHDVDDIYNHMKNQVASAQSTWEVIDSTATNGIPAVPATLGVGVSDPITTGTDYTGTSLRIKNTGGSAKTLWARSVTRKNVGLSQIVDGGFETGITIPGRLHSRPYWVPGNWPLVFWAPQYSWGWWPNGWWYGPYHIPAWWTHVNCIMQRTTTVSHSSTHSAMITPQGFSVYTGPTQQQFIDSGFETSNALVNWSLSNATNFSLTADSTNHHSGSKSLALTTITGSGSETLTSPLVVTVPNAAITCSYWVITPGGAGGGGTPAMSFFDQYGNLISKTNGTAITASSSWVQKTFTVTAPSNAQTVQFSITTTGAATTQINFDDFAWSTPATTGLAVCDTSSPWSSCPAGTAVTGTLWAYAPVALSTQVKAFIQWFDRWGTLLSTTLGTPATLAATTWTQLTASATAPANTAYCALGYAYTAAQATDISYIDDCSLSVGLTLSNNYPPELIDAVSDGIPIPWVRDSQVWDSTIRYGTGAIVMYEGQPFEALRASTGAQPPTNSVASPEWAPVGMDRRIRLMASAYTSQNLTVGTNQTAAVIPFVEWFDQGGNFIARLFARNSSGGTTVAKPDQLAFDSFTGPSVVASGGSGGSVPLGPWTGKYYTNTTLTGTPALTRTDATINFNWAGTSPGTGIPTSGWSAQWTYSFTPTVTGTYTFGGQQTGGGFRIIVNGVTVVDGWSAGTTSLVTGTISLSAGTTAAVTVQYYDTVVSGGGTTGNLVNSAWTFESKTTSAMAWCTNSSGGSSTYNGTIGKTVWSYTYGTASGGSSSAADVAVTGGAPFTLTATISGTGYDDTFYASIAWKNSTGGLISTTQSTYQDKASSSSWTFTYSGTAPSGAAYAEITAWVGPEYTGGGNFDYPTWSNPSFKQTITGSSASAMAVTTPATYTATGSTSTTNSLTGRLTDDRGSTWAVPTGSFSVGGFDEGTTWPTTVGTRSLATITGTANCRVGVTFRSNVASGSGQTQALVFRYSNDTNYWRATRTQLQKKVTGSWTTVGTYSTAFADGDRIVVQLNGSAITVYRNGNNSVLTATDSFNSTATLFGLVCE